MNKNFLAIAVVIAVALSGCSSDDSKKEEATTPDVSKVATYKNPETGVSLRHPTSWTTDYDSQYKAIVLYADAPTPGDQKAFRRNVNVVSQTYPGSLTSLTSDTHRQTMNMKITDAKETTLNGLPAREEVWEGKIAGSQEDLKYWSIWTLKDGKAWTVTYTSKPDKFAAKLTEAKEIGTSVQLP